MELKAILWEAFRDTGDIEAYLLYKNADTDNLVKEINGKEELLWQTSKPKVLS